MQQMHLPLVLIGCQEYYIGLEDTSSNGSHDDAEDTTTDDNRRNDDHLQQDAPIMLTALPVDEEAECAQQREVEDLRSKDLEHKEMQD